MHETFTANLSKNNLHSQYVQHKLLNYVWFGWKVEGKERSKPKNCQRGRTSLMTARQQSARFHEMVSLRKS